MTNNYIELIDGSVIAVRPDPSVTSPIFSGRYQSGESLVSNLMISLTDFV